MRELSTPLLVLCDLATAFGIISYGALLNCWKGWQSEVLFHSGCTLSWLGNSNRCWWERRNQHSGHFQVEPFSNLFSFPHFLKLLKLTWQGHLLVCGEKPSVPWWYPTRYCYPGLRWKCSGILVQLPGGYRDPMGWNYLKLNPNKIEWFAPKTIWFYPGYNFGWGERKWSMTWMFWTHNNRCLHYHIFIHVIVVFCVLLYCY